MKPFLGNQGSSAYVFSSAVVLIFSGSHGGNQGLSFGDRPRCEQGTDPTV
jgi:hypothetical protein